MQKPLCVDCDESLIKTDLLYESLLLLLKQHPQYLFLLPFWLLKGKAYFKQHIAEHVEIDFSLLPYNAEVIETIKEAKAKQRKVLLVTASPQSWADGINHELQLFDEAIGSNDTNLSGHKKADYLADRFGDRGFDYIGNSSTDLPVWKKAAAAIVVSSNSKLINKAAKLTEVKQTIQPPKRTIFSYLKAIRIHQWIKNILIGVPIAAAHQTYLPVIVQGLLAFVAFSLCASSVYLINDLFDIESDRKHIRKCNRPFAAGIIPAKHGVLLAPALLITSLAIAALLPIEFMFVLLFYFVMTVAYSLRLKHQMVELQKE